MALVYFVQHPLSLAMTIEYIFNLSSAPLNVTWHAVSTIQFYLLWHL